MSKEPAVIENHHTWLELSDGSVIVRGHRLWDQLSGQKPQAPNTQPSGPRRILRSEFDEMPHDQRHKALAEGAQVVDSLEQKAAPAPRKPPAITRARFDSMAESEKHAVVADIARGDAQLID